MHLYAFDGAPISADFRNRLRLAKILSGKAVVKNFGEIMQGIVSRTPYLLFAYTPCGADVFSCHIQPVIYNMYPSVPYGQSFPYKPWHKPPKEYDYPVSPIHGADRFTPFDGADNPFCNLSGAHQQRVVFMSVNRIFKPCIRANCSSASM